MDADVVVVGAGAGGAACAWSLANRGVRVLLLESGGWYEPGRLNRLHRPDWEQQGFPDDTRFTLPYVIAPLQPLDPARDGLRSWNRNLGRLAGDRRRAQRYQHVRGVGGTTLHFAGEAHRPHPASMRMFSRFGVGADWPLDYAELEPYYTQAEQALGVAGPGTDPHRPRSRPYPLPAHPHSYASQRIGLGCAKLGLSWAANPLAILPAPWQGRPGCNYCG